MILILGRVTQTLNDDEIREHGRTSDRTSRNIWATELLRQPRCAWPPGLIPVRFFERGRRIANRMMPERPILIDRQYP